MLRGPGYSMTTPANRVGRRTPPGDTKPVTCDQQLRTVCVHEPKESPPGGPVYGFQGTQLQRVAEH